MAAYPSKVELELFPIQYGRCYLPSLGSFVKILSGVGISCFLHMLLFTTFSGKY